MPVENPNPNLDFEIKISEMYARWTLDCFAQVAQGIAADYKQRPRQYPDNLPDDVTKTLTEFLYLTGSQPNWPNDAQRTEIFNPLFGASDGKLEGQRTSQFHAAAQALRDRAAKFVERVYDTGEDMLRNTFKDAIVTFRPYLNALKGSVVDTGYKQTQSIFESAKKVMTADGVARAFGVRPGPDTESSWPLGHAFDGDGAYFVEVVVSNLQLPNISALNQEKFIVLQRIAHYGSQTIREVLVDADGWDEKTRIDTLIDTAYRWKTALNELAAETSVWAGPAPEEG